MLKSFLFLLVFVLCSCSSYQYRVCGVKCSAFHGDMDFIEKTLLEHSSLIKDGSFFDLEVAKRLKNIEERLDVLEQH